MEVPPKGDVMCYMILALHNGWGLNMLRNDPLGRGKNKGEHVEKELRGAKLEDLQGHPPGKGAGRRLGRSGTSEGRTYYYVLQRWGALSENPSEQCSDQLWSHRRLPAST